MPPRAIVLAAHYFTQRGQPDPALALYHRYLRDYAGEEHEANVLLAAGDLHRELVQYRFARELLMRLVREYPHHTARAEALANLAHIADAQGRPDDALDYWRQLLAHRPIGKFWPLAAQRLARDLWQRQRFAEAAGIADDLVAQLTTWRETAPANSDKLALAKQFLPTSLFLQSQVLIAQQRWRPTLGPLLMLTSEFPASPLCLAAEYWQAEAHFRLGELAVAADRFDELARKTAGVDAPWVPSVELRRCQLACHRGEWTVALEMARSLDEAYPNFARAFEVDYCRGRAHAGRGEFALAREAYQRVIDSDLLSGETAAMAQWMIGETFLHQKHYDQAIEAYRQVEARGSYPEWEARAQLQVGKCYELLGRWRDAAATYESAIDRYPSAGVASSLVDRWQMASARQGGFE